MKRTLFLSLFLLLLVGVIVYLAKRQTAKTNALDSYEGNFAIEDIQAVSKVVIKHRAGPTYTLTKDRDGWKINNAYPARMSTVEPLLGALREMRIRYIPGDAAVKNVLENIEGTYVHVEVYDRANQKLKSFRVGGVTPDERGTYVLMDGSEQPFVVHIPSWDGALRTRFTPGLEDWRDRRFMTLKAEDIKSVKVEYPKQKSQSFNLERSGSGFILSPVYSDLRDYPKAYRSGTAEAFLKAISEAACEGYENQYARKDSIQSLTPFCTMEIGLVNNEQVEILIWPKGAPVYTQYSPPVHRLFIERKPGDFVLAQFEVIKGMLRGYDFFTGIETELVF
jgi:hypothetical protein